MTLLENVLQRYLAENFSIIKKKLPRRTHVEKICDEVLFNEIAGMNSRRSATSVKKKPPPRMSCMSSAFFIKFRVAYYRGAALLRRWSIIDFFLKKDYFVSLNSSFWVDFPKRVCGEFFL